MNKRKTGILILLTLGIFLSVHAHSFNYPPVNSLTGFSTVHSPTNHANWLECVHFLPCQFIPLKTIQNLSKTGIPQSLDLQHEPGISKVFLCGNNFQGGKNYLTHIYHSHHFW